MANIKKFIHFCIFICISSIFLMSENVGAVGVTLNLNGYDTPVIYRTPNILCTMSDNTTVTGSYCTGNMNKSIKSFDFSPSGNYEFKAGDIVEFYVLVSTPSDMFSNFSMLGFAKIVTNHFAFNLIDLQQVQNITGFDLGYNSPLYDTYSKISTIYKFTLLVRTNYTGYLGLTGTNSIPLFALLSGSSSDNFVISPFNYSVWRKTDEVSDVNKEQAEATQNAADESESAGESSESSAESATTSLLSAIGGAVSVISSASPTNCKINGNMGHIDMGQLDLCANPVPAYIQTIGSLIMIMICVPLAISLFNRFINLFRSFQN